LENLSYKEFNVNRYKISIILLNLIILSNLSYADNNLSKEKEEPIMLLPQSEQIQSSSKSKRITIDDVKKRLKEIEQKNMLEQIEIDSFEKKVRAYQRKVENLKTKKTNE